MAVLHASQSILEKWEQTQGQTQVLISHPAASVAAAMQAIQTTGISIVSTQAGVRIIFYILYNICMFCVYLFRKQTLLHNMPSKVWTWTSASP